MTVDQTTGLSAKHRLGIGLLATTLLVVAPAILTGLSSGDSKGLASSIRYQIEVASGADGTTKLANGQDGSVSVPLDARSLLALFQQKDYMIDTVRTGQSSVPRMVLAGLPSDMESLDSPDDRKRVFVKTMLPLILVVNEQITRDRDRLLTLQQQVESGHALGPKDRYWVARMADRYGLTARDPKGGDVNLSALLRRVDVVPVSLTLAQAAEESGWGTSRFAQDGNALFGQLTWTPEQQGIVPRNRKPGERHRFRSFDDLLASVQSYVHNLNTHRAYNRFRVVRSELRRTGKPLDGLRLVSTLDRYSERGEGYLQNLRALIRSNDFRDFDSAELHAQSQAAVLTPVVYRK